MGNRTKAEKKARKPKIRPIEHVPKHCDDYIEDETQPAALRKYLEFARAPGHGLQLPEPHPKLFAEDKDGKTVRVVMASRLGSVGWTHDLTADLGYQHRGYLEDLTNFRDTPDVHQGEVRLLVP